MNINIRIFKLNITQKLLIISSEDASVASHDCVQRLQNAREPLLYFLAFTLILSFLSILSSTQHHTPSSFFSYFSYFFKNFFTAHYYHYYYCHYSLTSRFLVHSLSDIFYPIEVSNNHAVSHRVFNGRRLHVLRAQPSPYHYLSLSLSQLAAPTQS